MSELQTRMPIKAVIEEYNRKKQNLEQEYQAFKDAGRQLMSSCTIMGTFGQENIDTGSNYQEDKLKTHLLKSAWITLWEGKDFNISRVATAKDKELFEKNLGMKTMPEFTLDNIRSTFGDYIQNPRQSILRGLAEVFCSLDPYYKSHEKIKIGVKGMPKRVIINCCNDFYGYGHNKVRDIINAIGVYQGIGSASREEINALFKDEYALMERKNVEIDQHKDGRFQKVEVTWPARGVHLRRYKNGNAHLFFTKETLKDVNMALAEYYGDALADAYESKPDKKSGSMAVSKDLQYYPTPQKIVDKIVDDIYGLEGKRVLEPSCGCGRFLDALAKKGAITSGIDVDRSRTLQCELKGHNVLTSNFLEVIPEANFDFVIMNPPFAGQHYFKHIQHAMKFLKEGGRLHSIVPSTARYDHGLIDAEYKARWTDLPHGSFRESGTNIETSVVKIIKE